MGNNHRQEDAQGEEGGEVHPRMDGQSEGGHVLEGGEKDRSELGGVPTEAPDHPIEEVEEGMEDDGE